MLKSVISTDLDESPVGCIEFDELGPVEVILGGSSELCEPDTSKASEGAEFALPLSAIAACRKSYTNSDMVERFFLSQRVRAHASQQL